MSTHADVPSQQDQDEALVADLLRRISDYLARRDSDDWYRLHSPHVELLSEARALLTTSMARIARLKAKVEP